ncbi:MAG TPA: ATPase, partial [Bacteroidales bacterium]|nr:ATPase [Bacteroidales bacterium]
MIIIADSGSTKTEWLILNGNQKTVLQSIGLNPFFVDTKEITKI